MSKYIYTLSSKKDMVQQVIVSINSLLNFVNSEDIIVFFTPPRKSEDIELLDSIGVDVREVDNVSSPTERTVGGEVRRFGEKLHLCSVDSDTVVFLDCDTVVLSNPKSVIEGDFDFKARPGDLPFKEDSWRNAFEKEGLEYVDWMPNAGFMIFKNGIHQEVEEDWKNHLGKGFEGHDLGHGPFTEQHALSFCLGNYNLEKMDEKYHCFVFGDEKTNNATVYHLGGKWDDSERKKDKIIELLDLVVDKVGRKF
jgi:hypothetical protein